jgi:hypothetical protein
MKTLPLTVLACEGPQARAYLVAMRRTGYRPERIVLLISSLHPATRKPVAPWLPEGMRRWFAGRVQEASANAWPRRIRSTHPHLVEACASALEPLLENAAGHIQEIVGTFVYEKYADRVDRVFAKGLSDPALAQALQALAPASVLYTGGGIVRPILLDIEGLRIMHIHPGYLPNIRGGDGLLWSILLRGRLGASCFLMDPGIDTGDLLLAHDFDPVRIDLGDHQRPDDLTLYRAIFSFVDPLYRAALLVDKILPLGDVPLDYPCSPQDKSAGVTYHFLHERLRAEALRMLFVGGS